MAAQNANDLSSVFKAVKERVSNFSNERQQLARTLHAIIRNAQELLGDLGEGLGGGRRGRAGRKGAAAGGRRKRRKLSAEARARIAAAQRARWARHRAGKK